MRTQDRIRRKLGRMRDAAVARCIAKPLHTHAAPWMLEYRPDSHFLHHRIQDDDALIRAWMQGHTTNNAGDLARFYNLYLNIEQVLREQIQGDFVELGVYKGNSAFLLAHLARRAGRHLYLFDTFSGFDSRDFVGEDRKRMHGHFSDTSLAGVRALVGESAVTYVKGFFPDSLSTVSPPETLAVVHLDCDLYEPMRAGLETFYPRLSPGGIMFLHVYSSGEWPGAQRAIDEFLQDKPERVVLIPDKSGTAVLRRNL